MRYENVFWFMKIEIRKVRYEWCENQTGSYILGEFSMNR